MSTHPARDRLDPHTDEIFERMADVTETMREIAASYGVSRRSLYNWAEAPERIERFELARQASADAHAERAGEILDELADRRGLTPAEVSLARERAMYHWRLATVTNRKRYGEGPQQTVQINVGSLHLDALRQAGTMPIALPHTGRTVEAELLEDGE